MASSAPDHLRTPGLISNRPCYEGINHRLNLADGILIKDGVSGPGEEPIAALRSKGLMRLKDTVCLALEISAGSLGECPHHQGRGGGHQPAQDLLHE